MSLIDNDVIKITAGQALSPQFLMGDKTLCGFFMPAGWDAAAMSFRVSPDGGATWSEYYDSKAGTSTVVVAAGQFIAVDSNMFRGINVIQFRSGTSAAPVNQTADRLITLSTKRVA